MTSPQHSDFHVAAAHDGPVPRALLSRAHLLTPLTLIYVATALLATTALWMTMPSMPHGFAWGAIMLLGAGIVGTRLEFQVSESTLVSSESIPTIVGVVLFPHAAPLFGAVMATAAFPSLRTRAFSTATYVLGCSAAGGTVLYLEQGSSSPSVAVLALACSVLSSVVNSALIAIFEAAVGGPSIRTNVPMLAGTTIASTLVLSPVVALMIAAYQAFGEWILPLVIIPLFLVQYFHGLYHRKAVLTRDLAASNETLARSNLQFAAAMVRALDARDAYTADHSAAVAVYTRDIAREAGYDDKTVRLAHLAGLLHDIGKIGIPGSILNKTDRLTDDEYEEMKDHARIGADILAEVDAYAEISMLVRYHHERIDGKGYPEGIGGDAIPAISRMISVADTYSAMTTNRPYRDGMPTEKAMKILGEASGSGQLDEMFTAVFLRILRTADADYQRGRQSSFDVEIARHEALSIYERGVLHDLRLPDFTQPGTQAA